MTTRHYAQYVQVLTPKELREFATQGMNAHANGMCPEEQERWEGVLSRRLGLTLAKRKTIKDPTP